MYILEIFFKRRKFMALFDDAWKVIGNNISMSQQAAKVSDPRLELYYFAAVFYCTLYHAAVAAGMSTSSAHYLARIQTRKSKVDTAIVSAAEEIFTSPDDEKLAGFGASLQQCIEPIVAAVARHDAADQEAQFNASMLALYQSFQQFEFSAAELFDTSGSE